MDILIVLCGYWTATEGYAQAGVIVVFTEKAKDTQLLL